MMASSSAASAAASRPKIAIIGAGAAGLAAARVFSRNGLEPVVLEQEPHVGGVWKYQPKQDDKKANAVGPMYRGLRTNLPKEVMRFRELPFRSSLQTSYVTHQQVLEYLQDYRDEFALNKYISFQSQVNNLSIVQDSKSVFSPPDDVWPKFQLEWKQEGEEEESQCHQDIFDAVCVCNGHYAKPSSPRIPGQEHFKGTIMHSITYDDPADYKDKTVLCIGARASGSDLTREIGEFAKHVYLSDSTNTESEPQTLGTITWVPKTIQIDSDGLVVFDKDCAIRPQVDVIIFCTGYDYSFPFLLGQKENENGNTNGENTKDDPLLTFVPGERRVTPLYQQLWHAKYPTLAFIGLPHSVVPFPLFELQAEALYTQWQQQQNGESTNGSTVEPLPSYEERLEAAQNDAESGGPQPQGGRVQDTHFLGSFQWDYCRQLAKIAGNWNEEIDNYIATNKALYDQSGSERKSLFPGGPDSYRETCFERDDAKQSFKIITSNGAANEKKEHQVV